MPGIAVTGCHILLSKYVSPEQNRSEFFYALFRKKDRLLCVGKTPVLCLILSFSDCKSVFLYLRGSRDRFQRSGIADSHLIAHVQNNCQLAIPCIDRVIVGIPL